MTERQMEALRLRVTPLSYVDIGKKMGINPSRAFQLTVKAVRALMHPSRRENHPEWSLVEKYRSLRGVRSL